MYASDWQPSKQKVENKLDEMTDTFQQAVHLLWNLCESNSTALKYFNQGNLLPVLAKCLEVSIFGIDTAIVVAHCLHTVTEENPTAVAKLQDSNLIIQNLLQLEGSEYSVLLLRTLACGLVLDLSYGKLSSLAPPVVTELLCNLSNILSVDHRKTLNAFTSTLPLDGETETSAQHEELLKSIKEMQYLLEAQQVAIELLANICSSDDADEKMDEDTSDVSSDEIISDIVLEAIVSGSLVLKVWEKTRLPAENVCQILNEHSEGKHLLNKLETLRCRALLCLNNLLAALDMQYLGGPLQVHEMFNNIVDTLHKEKDSGKVEFLESATSALRATLQKLAEFQFIDLNLTEEDLQSTFDTHRECPFPNVRSNLLRSIGLLGMNYSKSMVDDSQAKLRMVGEYLLYVCTRESELWVVAEAVDAIMDIFGEDCTDLAAAQIGLVEKLRVLLAPLKNKARLQRKSLGDHYLVVSTVNANLGRFIKYKSERISLIGSQ
ncbi:hypothetical protein C0J52_17789 [Blattella germanica]|nr:hypothetical protein C0J52_17789 [Blattella germanica]